MTPVQQSNVRKLRLLNYKFNSVTEKPDGEVILKNEVTLLTGRSFSIKVATLVDDTVEMHG